MEKRYTPWSINHEDGKVIFLGKHLNIIDAVNEDEYNENKEMYDTLWRPENFGY